MSKGETEQSNMPSLFPEVPPEREAIIVPMNELPPDVLLLSPEVSQDLVDSMNEWGLQQPIVVSPVRSNGDREVYAGNRRIKAARKLGWKEIEGYELTQSANAPEIDPRVLAEQLNATAKPNPIVQLESIEHLWDKGYDEKQIAKALKLKLGTVRARLRLQSLHPKIREGVKRNKISFGNADRAAKMSDATQERRARRFQEDGKLPWSVIDEERRRKVEAATASFDIDEELEEMPDFDDIGGSDHDARAGGYPAPIDEPERARLERRVAEVLEAGKKSSWSKADAESIRKLLEAL